MIPTDIVYRGKTYTLHCYYAKDFPSPLIFQSLGEEALRDGMSPIEHVRQRWSSGEFRSVEQQNLFGKFEVWTRECGLLHMGNTCAECKHARLMEPNPGNPAQLIPISWLTTKAKIG